MGAETKLKAGLTGGKEGKPPAGCRDGKVSRRPTGQALAGNMGGRASRRPSPCAPPRAPLTPAEPMPRGFRSRECKGRSPLHKKTKNLPLPAGKGVGGMGGRKQAKGRVDRRQRRQAPPPGTWGGRVSRQPSPCAPPLGTENGRGTPATPEISLSSRSAPGNAPEGG